jgi:Fe-Mn family superoxide dismutase
MLRTAIRRQSTVAHHGVPKFAALEAFQEKGIPGLLSPEAFQQAYVARSTLLADKLNKAIHRHSIQSADLDSLVSQHAKSATKRDIFNNASLLRNISFAMSSLGDARGSQTTVPPRAGPQSLLQTPSLSIEVDNHPPQHDKFDRAVGSSFGSLLELKTLLIESSYAINGDGFTWLVAVQPESTLLGKNNASFESLAVLNTYNAGHPENSDRFGQLTNISKENKVQEMTKRILPTVEDAQRESSNIGRTYYPLLCVDVSPKVWLHDYGVYGKRQYLEQYWRSIDWETVLKRLPEASMDKVRLV